MFRNPQSQQGNRSTKPTGQPRATAAFYLIKQAKLCDSRECQFCTEVRACRSHKRFEEFSRTPNYIHSRNFPVNSGISDMIPCWYNFVEKYLDGAKTLNCKAHKIAIPHHKNQFGKHIHGHHRDRIIETYMVLMERLSRNPHPGLKDLLMDKMHDYLVAIKQSVAAHKFRKNHNGERKWN